MKRYCSGLVVAGALAAAVGLQAQAQNPRTTPPPDSAAQPGTQRAPAPPAAQARTPNTVTLSGCIQSAPSATAAGAGASAQGPKYVLNSARMTAGGEAPRDAVGTTGTAATSYQLEGDATTISSHMNQQVEITGTIQASAASPTGAERAAPGSTASGPTLRVTSVKMVSATCTPQATTPGTTGQTAPQPEAPRPLTQPEQQPQQQQAPAPPPQP